MKKNPKLTNFIYFENETENNNFSEKIRCLLIELSKSKLISEKKNLYQLSMRFLRLQDMKKVKSTDVRIRDPRNKNQTKQKEG